METNQITPENLAKRNNNNGNEENISKNSLNNIDLKRNATKDSKNSEKVESLPENNNTNEIKEMSKEANEKEKSKVKKEEISKKDKKDLSKQKDDSKIEKKEKNEDNDNKYKYYYFIFGLISLIISIIIGILIKNKINKDKYVILDDKESEIFIEDDIIDNKNKEYKAIISIDFGSSYSGFAIAFGENSIESKTENIQPTTIAIKKNTLEGYKYGNDAENFMNEPRSNDYVYFDRIKTKFDPKFKDDIQPKLYIDSKFPSNYKINLRIVIKERIFKTIFR